MSQAQRNAMWTIRDSVEQLFDLGPMLMFDVSLPISAMEAYVSEVRARLASGWKDHDCVVWGHLGDSNLHLWITVQSMSPEARSQVERIVYEPLRRVGGSISAEHGIGVEKREHLGISRTADEIALMYSLKHAFDPAGLLNPGKVLI
jgi:FAD/FMN-containing dehydrogenase